MNDEMVLADKKKLRVKKKIIEHIKNNGECPSALVKVDRYTHQMYVPAE